MGEQYFRVEKQQHVWSIVLDHMPLNCLVPEFMDRLGNTLDNIKYEPLADRPRAVVLRSAIEGQFCSGMDPKYFVEADLDERKRVFLELAEMLEAFYKFGIPIISVVSGPALAGGAVLAFLGDIILMDSNHGSICFSEVKVGLPVPGIIQDLIVFKTGTTRLIDIALLGRNIAPDLALKTGIADAVYANGAELDKLLADYVGRFVRLNPEVVSATMWEIKQPLLSGKADFLHSFEDTFAPFLTDEYLGRGLTALLEGKKPSWG